MNDSYVHPRIRDTWGIFVGVFGLIIKLLEFIWNGLLLITIGIEWFFSLRVVSSIFLSASLLFFIWFTFTVVGQTPDRALETIIMGKYNSYPDTMIVPFPIQIPNMFNSKKEFDEAAKAAYPHIDSIKIEVPLIANPEFVIMTWYKRKIMPEDYLAEVKFERVLQSYSVIAH